MLFPLLMGKLRGMPRHLPQAHNQETEQTLTVPLAASPSCCYKLLSELHILVLKVTSHGKFVNIPKETFLRTKHWEQPKDVLKWKNICQESLNQHGKLKTRLRPNEVHPTIVISPRHTEKSPNYERPGKDRICERKGAKVAAWTNDADTEHHWEGRLCRRSSASKVILTVTKTRLPATWDVETRLK